MTNTLVLTTSIFYLVSGILSPIQPIQAQSNLVSSSKWKTLNRANYSIRYPSDWSLEHTKNLGNIPPDIDYIFTILSPLESTNDRFRENVNLVIEDLNGQQIDLVKYSQLAKTQIELHMKNTEIIEDQMVSTNKLRKYHKLIWTWDYEMLELKVEQYSWMLNGKVYVLTFTSEQDKFAKFKTISKSILDTFRLKP